MEKMPWDFGRNPVCIMAALRKINGTEMVPLGHRLINHFIYPSFPSFRPSHVTQNTHTRGRIKAIQHHHIHSVSTPTPLAVTGPYGQLASQKLGCRFSGVVLVYSICEKPLYFHQLLQYQSEFDTFKLCQ